jgi:hypothetical protein
MGLLNFTKVYFQHLNYQGGLNGTHGTFSKDQETQAKASPLHIIPLVSGTIMHKNFEWNDVWCGEHVSTNMKVCA